MTDVQVVRETCVLPLGSARVHELAPLIKSVLLAGPPLCGKSLLADIVCTETGALRVDLTPEAVAAAREKYPGKKNWKLFLHMVNKVARLLAPTVIVMDNAHRNYYKRVRVHATRQWLYGNLHEQYPIMDHSSLDFGRL